MTVAYDEIKSTIERIGDDARTQFRQLDERYRREFDSMRRAANETKEYADAVSAAVHQKLDGRISEVSDEVMTALNRRLNMVDGGDEQPKVSPEAKAFDHYCRRGREALSPDEIKVLHVGTDSAGGYLAPTQFVRELQRALSEASPMRRLARVFQTDSGSIELPRQTAGSAAAWVGELEVRPESNLAFGSTTINVHELATWTDVSLKLLEDSAFSIDELLATDYGEAFAEAEGAAILVGDGTNKPSGILHASTTGLTQVVSGHATEVTPDSLIRVLYAGGAGVARNGTWLMSTATSSVVRQLKDTTNRYLWADANAGLVPGQPASLLGRPVEIDDTMPAIAAGSFPILYGDFRRAVWLVTRPNAGVSILRDDFTQRTSGKVRFHARMRVGAGVVRPEALTKLKIGLS